MGAPSHSLIANSLQYKRSQGRNLTYKKLLVMRRRNAAILKSRRVVTKRRPRCEKGEEEDDDDGLKRRVWTLKSLIPKSESDSNGLEGLFRDTADYILDLQMRVGLMQMMVDALSGCTSLE